MSVIKSIPSNNFEFIKKQFFNYCYFFCEKGRDINLKKMNERELKTIQKTKFHYFVSNETN